MDNLEKLKIQKLYLGNLFIEITKEELDVLDSIFHRKIKTNFFTGSRDYLKKTAAYFLLTKGKWLEYRYVTSSEILGNWLGKEVTGVGEYHTFHLDLSTPILFIHHLKFSAPNKHLELLLCQQVTERDNRGLITIVLSEEPLTELKDGMRSLGLSVQQYKLDSYFHKK